MPGKKYPSAHNSKKRKNKYLCIHPKCSYEPEFDQRSYWSHIRKHGRKIQEDDESDEESSPGSWKSLGSWITTGSEADTEEEEASPKPTNEGSRWPRMVKGKKFEKEDLLPKEKYSDFFFWRHLENYLNGSQYTVQGPIHRQGRRKKDYIPTLDHDGYWGFVKPEGEAKVFKKLLMHRSNMINPSKTMKEGDWVQCRVAKDERTPYQFHCCRYFIRAMSGFRAKP